MSLLPKLPFVTDLVTINGLHDKKHMNELDITLHCQERTISQNFSSTKTWSPTMSDFLQYEVILATRFAIVFVLFWFGFLSFGF